MKGEKQETKLYGLQSRGGGCLVLLSGAEGF